MSSYDKQYTAEENLFGSPYKAFETFIKTHAHPNGIALDLGCGQGRDALMLAQYGYAVTGVDASEVGIAQMLQRAKSQNLAVNGVIDNLYTYTPSSNVDVVVLDSILHFEKADKEKELALLNRVTTYINPNGYLFIFVHKSPQKEKELKQWLTTTNTLLTRIQEGYIDYTYEEKQSNFKSTFQFYMLILQRIITTQG